MKNGAFTIADMQRLEREDKAIALPGRVPVFKFGQRCHPGAGLSAEYALGVMVLACHACGGELCRVQVSE